MHCIICKNRDIALSDLFVNLLVFSILTQQLTGGYMSKNAENKYPNLFQDVRIARRMMWVSRGGKTGYQFHVFSVGERGTTLSVEIIREVKDGLVEKLSPYVEQCECLMTVVPGGNQWGVLLADAVNLPLTIIRDGTSHFSDEVPVKQKNHLYKRTLYFRESMRDQKVVLIDDVISSGGTIDFVISQLRKLGAHVQCVVVVILKGTAYLDVAEKHGIPIHGLLQVDADRVTVTK